MNAKRWAALIIFFVLFASLALNPYACVSFLALDDEDWEQVVYREGTGDEIALIDIAGVIIATPPGTYAYEEIYNHEILLDQLEEAFSNDDIKAVILRLNSPGGGVAECDEILQEIVKHQKDHDKPLVVYMDEIAASGAYLISAPADIIMANRHTLTGAIGVIISTINVYELAEEWGIKQESFKSGPYKDMLNPLQEVEEEEREIMQELVDESFAFLIDSIVEQREMERDDLLKLADGRIFSGFQAQDKGLVDELGTMDDAIESAGKLAQTEDPEVIHYRSLAPSTFDLFFSRVNQSFNIGEDMEKLLFQRYHHPSLMYMWIN